MPPRKPDDPKRTALARAATLHPHPEQVSDTLFRDNPFFDPRDLVQVKYEMLRRVRVDRHAVNEAAAACGLSRPTYYQSRKAFERDGIVGLLPEKKGPKRAHKLTVEVLNFVEAQLQAQPELSAPELVRLIRSNYGVDIHPKSIARARVRSKEKNAALEPPPTASTVELNKGYEDLRSHATEASPSARHGLALLRQQGLKAWVAFSTTQTPSHLRTEASTLVARPPLAPHDPAVAMPADLAPLLDLCTQMLISKLTSEPQQEIR